MAYTLYPAIDNASHQFPPIVRGALAVSPELRHLVIPMSEVDRNNLAGSELWNGRLIFNTTTTKINRRSTTPPGWYEIDSDVRTSPVVLPGLPTEDLHAASKSYVDTRVERSGDSMTGALTLSSLPVNPMHAAPKEYVDQLFKSGEAKIQFTDGWGSISHGLGRIPASCMVTLGAGTWEDSHVAAGVDSYAPNASNFSVMITKSGSHYTGMADIYWLVT